MSGLFGFVSNLLGGGGGGGAEEHAHTHGGQPCHGHGAPPPQQHGHSHDGRPCDGHHAPPPMMHGHSHDGRPCDGHHAPPPMMHGHSHDGKPCDGHHGGAGTMQQPMPMGEFPFSREQLLQFMQKFIAEIETPESKAKLRAAVEEKVQVESASEAIQRELLKAMGIDADKGIGSLQYVQRMFPTDREIQQTFMQFVTSESMACDEAEMGPEDFKAKLKMMSDEIKQRQLMMVQQRATAMGLPADKLGELTQFVQAEQDKLSPKPNMSEQQQLMMRVQAKLQELLALTPEQEERLKKAAVERMQPRLQANPNMTDQEMMQQAMAKLQMASQMIKQSGMTEQQVTEELMKRIREGNFQMPPGMQFPPPGSTVASAAPTAVPSAGVGRTSQHHDDGDVPEELSPNKVERL